MIRFMKLWLALGVLLVLTVPGLTGLPWAQGGPAQEPNHPGPRQLQPAPGEPQENTPQEIIRSNLQQQPASGFIRLGEVSIPFTGILANFYANRDYRPAWTDPRAVEELIRATKDSKADGLSPEDYHLQAIENLFPPGKGQAPPELAAARDLLMTDALLRLGYHLRFGKIDPQSLFPDMGLKQTGADVDIIKTGQEAIDTVQIPAWLETLRPQNPYYAALKKALADHRDIAAKGGWPAIPPGPTLKKGSKDRRVPALRQRLAMTGDLDAGSAANPSPVYDEPTVEAVKHFQSRHGIKPDGVLDAATLEALYVPVAQRLDQIRVNLERGRWVLRNPPEKTQVLVNIAAFTLDYTDAAGQSWQTKVVVGKPYRKTPVIESKIDEVIFNPPWNVPPSIAESEILPKIEKDPSYLRRHHFRLESRHPLKIVQEPGPHNALGRVKFNFPNQYDVYLHDTPERQLFGESDRTFSHGCIRVQDALHLAVLLLQDPAWNMEKIRRILRSTRTVTEKLKEPVPIVVVYRTVTVIPGDGLAFLPDVYQRDFEVLSALDQHRQAP